MDADPDAWLPGVEPSPDLEYDEAHDAQAQVLGAADSVDADEAPELTYVATETPAYDGDYSYDLSHDVPPPTR
jgi:hypothetical protein